MTKRPGTRKGIKDGHNKQLQPRPFFIKADPARPRCWLIKQGIAWRKATAISLLAPALTIEGEWRGVGVVSRRGKEFVVTA